MDIIPVIIMPDKITIIKTFGGGVQFNRRESVVLEELVALDEAIILQIINGDIQVHQRTITDAIIIGDDPDSPVIFSLSTEVWKEDQVGIEVNGVGFGFTQGSGNVRLTSQGRDEDDRITGNMTVTEWTPSKITFTAVLPQNGATDWPGYFDVSVIHDSDSESGTTQILIGPNQSTNASQTDAGFVQLTNSSPQTVIAGESAGTSYWCDTLLTEKTLTMKTGDTFIGGPNGGMRGAKDISHSNTPWSVDGNSWKLTGQTQSDTGNNPTRISNLSDWHEDNDRVGSIFIGPRNCQVRRGGSKANIEAAISTGSLATDSFDTVSGERWLKVNHNSHGKEFGQVVKLSGASAGGGITVDGFYVVVRFALNYYIIEHDSPATSTGSSGGSVSYTYDIRTHFDGGANNMWLNIDPTTDFDILATTTTEAFNGTANNVTIRGSRTTAFTGANDVTGFFPIYCYNQQAQNAVIQPGSSANGWMVQFLDVHHNKFNIRLRGNDGEIWDCKQNWAGQLGGGSGGSYLRRLEFAYNNVCNYAVGWEAGACKYALNSFIDIDQVTTHHNLGDSFWLDVNNDDCTLARIHGFENARYGIHFELTSTVNGVSISNCLLQTGFHRSHSYFRLLPGAFFISAAGGSAAEPIVIDGNQVEIPGTIDKDPTAGPENDGVNALAIYTDQRGNASDYITFSNNVVVYEGTGPGMPQSGMMWNGGPQSNVDAMTSTAVFTNNVYYHTGGSGDDIFHYVDNGPTNANKTFAEFKALGYDTDSTVNFNQTGGQITAAKSSWVRGDMPTWSDVQDT